jgi:hypothetical protein
MLGILELGGGGGQHIPTPAGGGSGRRRRAGQRVPETMSRDRPDQGQLFASPRETRDLAIRQFGMSRPVGNGAQELLQALLR